MTAWVAFIVGGVATYLMRSSFITWTDRSLPHAVERALRYVGPAAFAAIVLPRVLRDDGLAQLGAPDARVLAAIACGLSVWRWRNVAIGLVVGMAALWLLQWSGMS